MFIFAFIKPKYIERYAPTSHFDSLEHAEFYLSHILPPVSEGCGAEEQTLWLQSVHDCRARIFVYIDLVLAENRKFKFPFER